MLQFLGLGLKLCLIEFQEIFQFMLQENNKPNTVVGRVNAHDKDYGENGKVKYFFQPTHEHFTIDETSGSSKLWVLNHW
jgi:hypothetical protein